MADTTGTILGATTIITATTVLRNAKEKKDKGQTFKPIVFGFGLAFALLAVSMVAPGLARALAYMGLVGAFAVNGPAIFDTIGKLGSK